MVINDNPRLDATFAALADPTRRAILARLASGQATVNELAEPFAISQPAISKHLRVLENAGLISRDREAQRRPSRLDPKRLAEASAWLNQYRQFWETSFVRLVGPCNNILRRHLIRNPNQIEQGGLAQIKSVSAQQAA